MSLQGSQSLSVLGAKLTEANRLKEELLACFDRLQIDLNILNTDIIARIWNLSSSKEGNLKLLCSSHIQ